MERRNGRREPILDKQYRVERRIPRGRLQRIEGHARGLPRLVENDEYCAEIVT